MTGAVLTCVPAGGAAGMHAMAQGTANTPPANSVMIQAPTSVPTAYGITLPGAPAAGFVKRTNANPSVESVGAIVGADLPNPAASVLGGVQSKDCSTGGNNAVQKINTDGSISCVTISGSGSGFDPLDSTTVWFRDDFLHLGPSGTTGLYGDLQWTKTNGAGSGAVTYKIGIANHPGIGNLATTAGATDDTFLAIGTISNTPFIGLASATGGCTIVVRLNQTTNERFLAGFISTTSPGASDVIGVRYDTTLSDTKFTLVACNAGTCSTASTNSIAVDTNFHTFKLTFTGGVVSMTVDGGAADTVSTNLPSVAIHFGIGVRNATTSAHDIDVDLLAAMVTLTR
jgi:hypothetical protein